MVNYLTLSCCGGMHEFSERGYAMACIEGIKCNSCGHDIVKGESIDKMIEICLNHLKNEKHINFITSLKDYYEAREMLTEKQYKALIKWRKIIDNRLHSR